MLPEAVRQEEDGWRERLFVRVLPRAGRAAQADQAPAGSLEHHRGMARAAAAGLLELCGCTAETVRRLEDQGLVTIAPQISERDPYAHEHILPTQPLALNPEQAARSRSRSSPAMDGSAVRRPPTGGSPPQLDLPAPRRHRQRQDRGLSAGHRPRARAGPGRHRAGAGNLAHAADRRALQGPLRCGPLQTLVAVLHSHLSAGERHDEWHKIRQGRARIVIGARSAIFAPVDPLGLIVVDEEHEHSYKQEEAPRYHARDVAVVRGQLEGAVVVLGSATPSLESYYNAQRGKYALLELPHRVDDKKMPLVRVVDMRQAGRGAEGHARSSRRSSRKPSASGWNDASRPSCSSTAAATPPRCSAPSAATSPSARTAAWPSPITATTRSCSATSAATRPPRPAVCPEPELPQPGHPLRRPRHAEGRGHPRPSSFPHARIQRMDSDALKRKEDYRRILGDFRAGKIDILVGTQMIAKGLHFPERHAGRHHLRRPRACTCRISAPASAPSSCSPRWPGRAGRGDVEGEVFVQTFTPFHPAIQYARRHDFAGFYEQEIEFREQLHYPPFTRVALLTLKGRNEDKVRFSAEHVRQANSRTLLSTGGVSSGRRLPAPAEDLFAGREAGEAGPRLRIGARLRRAGHPS